MRIYDFLILPIPQTTEYSYDLHTASADLCSCIRSLLCVYVCVKTRGRANGENIRPIFRDRRDLCTPTTIWGRLSIRVYQILSPTKLCIWVDTLLVYGMSLHRVYSKKR